MKALRLPFFFLLAIGLLAWSGCSDDDDDLIIETLNYDGDNFTAPNLDANIFAAYFPPSELQNVTDRNLESVAFFLEAVPPEVEVIVYAAGATDREPGAELYRSPSLLNRVNATGEFITHRLRTPIDLSQQNDGIWLAIQTDIAPGNRVQSVGCDAGNNYNPNGDRIRIGNTWTSFNEVTGSEQVNWNIRGILSSVN